MLKKPITVAGAVAILLAGTALATSLEMRTMHDKETTVTAVKPPVADPPTTTQSKPPRARASASASSSASATAGAGGTDCTASASTTIERDGKRITIERSQHAKDGATGCDAKARARTGTTTDE